MTFTVSDFNDFKQLLLDHPAWQVEVRRLLLAEDFEALPGIVRRLAEAQERLVEGQNSTDQRLARLGVTLAKVNGRTLEGEYREKAPAYFGRWIRRTTVVARTALGSRPWGQAAV
jgi:hypothetical protein